MTPVNVTVTGAAGAIGYALLFRIASGQMLGPDTPMHLRLLEIPDAVKAAEGTAMELDDCAFPLLAGIDIHDDPNGAVAQLATKAGCQVSDISNMAVWGNHSPTMFPDLFNAKVNGRPAVEQVDLDWYENEYIPRVGKRGAEIIEARGASSAASAANAAIDCMRDWVAGADGLRSMAVRSGGEYGVEEGLMSSFPLRLSGGGFEIVEGLEVGDFAQAKIDATVAELKEERDAVRELSLV